MLPIFIPFHFRSRTTLLDGGVARCERCDADTPRVISLYYRYQGIFWAFSFVTAKHYYSICRFCEHTVDLPRREAMKILGGEPIPLRQRYGCLVPVVLIILLFLRSL